MYLQRGEIQDKEQAIACFEKILKEYPNEHDTMKILGKKSFQPMTKRFITYDMIHLRYDSYCLGHLYAESNQKDKLKLAQEYLEKVTKSDPRDWESIIDYAQVLERNRPDKSLEGTCFTH